MIIIEHEEKVRITYSVRPAQYLVYHPSIGLIQSVYGNAQGNYQGEDRNE